MPYRILLPLFTNYCFRISIALFCSLVCVGSVCAKQADKNVTVVFSYFDAPYVFSDGTGVAVDLVRQILASEGYTLIPFLVPLKRGQQMFQDNQCDAVAIVQRNAHLHEALYSDFFIHYHNAGIVVDLAENSWIQGMNDIRFLDILAYENAQLYLGDIFRGLVAANKKYRETEDQEQQVLMLMRGRTDIAIMDKAIFRYYHERLLQRGLVSPEKQVRFVEMFLPSSYRVAFKNRQLLKAFNRGILMLEESGGDRKVYKKYNVGHDKMGGE